MKIYRREVGWSPRLAVGPVEIADGDISPVKRVDLGVEQVGEGDRYRRDPNDSDDCQHKTGTHPWLQRVNYRHVPTSQ